MIALFFLISCSRNDFNLEPQSSFSITSVPLASYSASSMVSTLHNNGYSYLTDEKYLDSIKYSVNQYVSVSSTVDYVESLEVFYLV